MKDRSHGIIGASAAAVFFASTAMQCPALAQSPLNQDNFQEYQRLLAPRPTPPKLRLKSLAPRGLATAVSPTRCARTRPRRFKPLFSVLGNFPVRLTIRSTAFSFGTKSLWKRPQSIMCLRQQNASEEERRKRLQQPGPHRSSRAMAIVHVAMFEAVNAMAPRRYDTLTGISDVNAPVSLNVAVAVAAHDTLVEVLSGTKQED